MSSAVREYFADYAAKMGQARQEWDAIFEEWKLANPALAEELAAGVENAAEDLLQQIPEFPADTNTATRASGGVVINAVANAVPQFITGSADLFGSTKNYIKEGGDFSAENYAGRNVWFGIREHAMGAMCNGIAYDGIFRVSAATFMVFADYCDPPFAWPVWRNYL